ncbi:uncharacterized protein LOC111628623 [Centruroides sculpturatus]|uniref:uncharacterized protein LOC111628623 n=1 Tax=Centruroides sculpturatus TaxID=218467 RepID=UPI000C6EE2D4|nr:uncharacterized protein LOC111628623 [Centruroides sculpturatus]
MVMIRKCCFCWNTKEGSIAAGIYTMIGRIISVIVTIIFLAKPKLLKEKVVEWGMKKDDLPVVRGILVATLVASLIFIMFCVFVVYGAVKDRRGFLLPWVIVMSIEVAIQIISLFAIIVVVATRKEAKVSFRIIFKHSSANLENERKLTETMMEIIVLLIFYL